MRRFASASFLSMLGIMCFTLSGCGAGSPTAALKGDSVRDEGEEHHHGHNHDHAGGKSHHHHDHSGGQMDEPENFAEAVKQVDALHAAAKSALFAENAEKADGPIHKLGHLLEDLPQLAAKESMPDSDQAAIRKAVDELFDCYTRLDDKLHGNGGATYDDVSTRIDAALDTLHSAVK